MENPFLPYAEKHIKFILDFESDKNENLLLKAAVCGFMPHNSTNQKLVEWLQNLKPKKLRFAIWSIDMDLETRKPDDGFMIAWDQFMIEGIKKFLHRYKFTLKGEVKKQFDTLQETINKNIEEVKDTETYQVAYAAFEQATKEE